MPVVVVRFSLGSRGIVRDGLASSIRSNRSSSTLVQSREKTLKFAPPATTVASRG